ncbi:MAG TPA: glycine betaine ABC transporter substrate-binding protein [Candidatus Aquilonibacter sp.]|nr:glycine betaine ABC transporter substrate-binding protein [Candidatus Aquilonibacter sp.]
MNLSRSRALALIASAPLLARCTTSGSIRVGSKNFTESIVIGEIYAQALEAAGMRVERRLNLGSTQIALAAIQRGDIDLYPEYTGTALIDVLHHAPVATPEQTFEIVDKAFSARYGLSWLAPSPMNDSQGIATTAALAQRYHLRTLSDLASAAPRLRLATIQEFLARPDGLPGLQKRYGGFHFKSVRTYDIALKYQALLDGRADVATAFTTDGAIAANHLQLLADDKHLWPPYNVAPVVRAALLGDDRAVATLNAVSPKITSAVASRMNEMVESEKQDPADVARAFLKGSIR